MKLSLACGDPPHVIEQTWTADEFVEMWEAHMQNRVDVDGWQKTGAMIVHLQRPHYQEYSLEGEDWYLFQPQVVDKPGSHRKKMTGDEMETAVMRAYQ